MNRQIIADKIVELIQKDVDNELRETDGKNRSERIDSFNTRAGAPLGSPYCASAGWCAIDDACKELNLKNPVKPTASSQKFRDDKFIPKKYFRAHGELGRKGDVGVFQVVGDQTRGHYVTVAEDQTEANRNEFKTLEYNTDGSGSRDGDGAYRMARRVEGRVGNKFFLLFADIPQYILDENSEDKLLTT